MSLEKEIEVPRSNNGSCPSCGFSIAYWYKLTIQKTSKRLAVCVNCGKPFLLELLPGEKE